MILQCILFSKSHSLNYKNVIKSLYSRVKPKLLSETNATYSIEGVVGFGMLGGEEKRNMTV